MRISLLVLALFSFSLAAAQPSADPTPKKTIDRQLRLVDEKALEEGYEMNKVVEYVWLNDDETSVMNIRLSSLSEHFIVGACDGDCGDLDLKLTDPDTGEVIIIDEKTDALPILGFDLDLSKTYQLEIKMYDCSTEPCMAGVSFYSR